MFMVHGFQKIGSMKMNYSWSNGYTFSVDYVSNGLYGVFACDKDTDDYTLLKTDKNVYRLFKYMIDIAGEAVECELSETAILANELEDIITE